MDYARLFVFSSALGEVVEAQRGSATAFLVQVSTDHVNKEHSSKQFYCIELLCHSGVRYANCCRKTRSTRLSPLFSKRCVDPLSPDSWQELTSVTNSSFCLFYLRGRIYLQGMLSYPRSSVVDLITSRCQH
jgi:hypothetical protein